MKVLETLYNGYRFRSRLEARWACFFDTLGIPYEYEKEGYDLDDAGWYVPDFWLPQFSRWIEIEGQEPTYKERLKALRLAQFSGYWVHLFEGSLCIPRSEKGVCVVTEPKTGVGFLKYSKSA